MSLQQLILSVVHSLKYHQHYSYSSTSSSTSFECLTAFHSDRPVKVAHFRFENCVLKIKSQLLLHHVEEIPRVVILNELRVKEPPDLRHY